MAARIVEKKKLLDCCRPSHHHPSYFLLCFVLHQQSSGRVFRVPTAHSFTYEKMASITPSPMRSKPLSRVWDRKINTVSMFQRLLEASRVWGFHKKGKNTNENADDTQSQHFQSTIAKRYSHVDSSDPFLTLHHHLAADDSDRSSSPSPATLPLSQQSQLLREKSQMSLLIVNTAKATFVSCKNKTLEM